MGGIMNALLRIAFALVAICAVAHAQTVSASSCVDCMGATSGGGWWCGGNTCYSSFQLNRDDCSGTCTGSGGSCGSLCTGSCGPCKKSSKWSGSYCCSSSSSCGSCCECGGFIGGMVALAIGLILICVLLCCYFCTCCPWYKRRTQQQTFNSGTAVTQAQM